MDIQKLVRNPNDPKRIEQAQQFTVKGFELIAQASAEKYDERDLLSQASKLFIRATKLNKKSPEPFIGLGYLMILFRDYKKAQSYLLQALQRDRNHPDARALIEVALHPPSSEEDDDLPLVEDAVPPVTPQEFDKLYDIVEAVITGTVNDFMQLEPPEFNGPESLVYEHAKKLKRFEKIYGLINLKIRTLDEDLDVTDLQEALTPYRQLLKRHQKVLDQNLNGLELLQEIHQKNKQLLHSLKALQSSPQRQLFQEYEQTLELAMDMCDHFADQLDIFDENHLDIQAFDAPYRRFLNTVERYRDSFEDIKLALKT